MRWRLVLMFVLSGFIVPGLRAADLIEEWAPGLSDLEFYWGGSLEDGGTDSTMVLGYGAGAGFSLGLLISHAGSEADHAGAVAIWSSPKGSVDFWVLTTPSIEREIASSGISWEFGMEWSGKCAGANVVYFRPSRLFDDSGGHWHPLVGLMVPLSPIELHFELSSEEPEEGSWPLHLAVGPNFAVSGAVEIIPEISWINEGHDLKSHWEWSLGVIITMGRS